MPRALKERDTPFKLIILDRRDGHIIYETTDANQGWDGIDRQTGTMVDYEQTYIWKVTLVSPQPGEQAEYFGTIIPLHKR